MIENTSNNSNYTPDEQDVRDAVSYIQNNLLHLSFHDSDIPPVAIDGIWGEESANALKKFQEKYGLQPTGTADLHTWELLRDVADNSRKFHSPTQPILIFPRYPEDYRFTNESSPEQIRILQYVLRELGTEYAFGDISLSGIYDNVTQSAVKSFQEKNGLTPSGTVDRTTWNSIAEQYNVIADISNR